MGTNYYLHTDECAHCGRSDEPLHIGKSSAGWCFALHVWERNEGEGEGGKPTCLADWRVLWTKPDATIRSEYGEVIIPSRMLKVITERRWEGDASDLSPAWYARNHAPGPNGLLRHTPGRGCLRHGDGTYDFVTGYFS